MISSVKNQNYLQKIIVIGYPKVSKFEMIDEIKTSLETDISKLKNIQTIIECIIINMRYDDLLTPVLFEVDHDFPYLRSSF